MWLHPAFFFSNLHRMKRFVLKLVYIILLYDFNTRLNKIARLSKYSLKGYFNSARGSAPRDILRVFYKRAESPT